MAVLLEAAIPALVLGHVYILALLSLLYWHARKGSKSKQGKELFRKNSRAPRSHSSIVISPQAAVAPSSPFAIALTKRESFKSDGATPSVRVSAVVDARQVRLSWSDLSCVFTNSKGKATTVLEKQYGSAEPGQLLAVMGPSGAGKSTLMDILAARSLQGGTVSGAVCVNGARMSAKHFLHLRTYVPQEDSFVPSMSALETVRFHAALDLPPGLPKGALEARVNNVMQVVGLAAHGHTLVGGTLPGGLPLRGLSGGQKRRLNIACHIVAAPPVVFLDEPTSGLDSAAAIKVMIYLKMHANQGHTVIATLHQPRASIWKLLDSVLFLACGRMMYLGDPEHVVPWFSGTLGCSYLPLQDGLPSDWLMDLLSLELVRTRKKTQMIVQAAIDARASRGGLGPGRQMSLHRSNSNTSGASGVAPALHPFPSLRRRASLPRSRASGSGQVLVHSSSMPHPGHGGHSLYSQGSRDGGSRVGPLGDTREGALGEEEGPEHAVAVSPVAVQVAHVFATGGLATVSDIQDASEAFLEEYLQGRAGTLAGVLAGARQERQEKVAEAAASAGNGNANANGNGAAAAAGDVVAVAALHIEVEGGPQGEGGGGGDTDALAPPNLTLWQHARAWLQQLRVLLWREGIIITRNPADAAGRMGVCMYTAVVQGFVFINLSTSGSAFQARLGALFIYLSTVILLPFANMSLIHANSQQVVHEAAEGVYKLSACYAARFALNTVLNSLNAALYGFIGYGLIGFRRGAEHIWRTIFVLIMSHLVLLQVMMASTVVMPTQDLAFMVSILHCALFMLLANFLIRWQEMAWSWVAAIRFINPLYFGFGTLVEDEFKDRTFECNEVTGVACVDDGNVVVALYTDYGFGTTAGMLVAYWMGMHAVTYLCLVWRLRGMRGKTSAAAGKASGEVRRRKLPRFGQTIHK